MNIDWSYTVVFTTIAIAGVFVGSAVVPYVSQGLLKRSFAIFLVVVAGFILLQSYGSGASSAKQVGEPQRTAARR